MNEIMFKPFVATGVIILIAVLSAAVLIAVFLVLFLSYRQSNRKKSLDKLDAVLTNLDTVNIPQVEAYLLRLKNIAMVNNEYGEVYSQLNASFQQLKTTEKDKITQRQKGIKGRIAQEKRINKNIQEQIDKFENAVNDYKKQIERIQKDLENLFKTGDDLRVKVTELQQKYQKLLSDINNYSSALEICRAEINNYTNGIELLFDLVQENLSQALYNSAMSTIENIEAEISKFAGQVEIRAQYCNMVTKFIPMQLEELNEKATRLDEEGYVVPKNDIANFIDNVNHILDVCKLSFKHLQFDEFPAIREEIEEKLNDAHGFLDVEVKAKSELDEKYSVISKKVEEAEDSFIKTKRQYATMTEFYKLQEETYAKYNSFQDNCLELSRRKREYEKNISINVKMEASYLLSLVDKMDKLADVVMEDVDYFNNYFKNIKDFVEDTYNKVITLQKTLTTTMGEVRYNKCFKVYNKYYQEVKSDIKNLEAIKKILLTRPIDIQELYNSFNDLVTACTTLNNAVLNELSNYQTVIKSIIFVNPLRAKYNDVNLTLESVEQLFEDGNYKECQEKLNYIMNNYHEEAFEQFKD